MKFNLTIFKYLTVICLLCYGYTSYKPIAMPKGVNGYAYYVEDDVWDGSYNNYGWESDYGSTAGDSGFDDDDNDSGYYVKFDDNSYDDYYSGGACMGTCIDNHTTEGYEDTHYVRIPISNGYGGNDSSSYNDPDHQDFTNGINDNNEDSGYSSSGGSSGNDDTAVDPTSNISCPTGQKLLKYPGKSTNEINTGDCKCVWMQT